MLFLPGPAWLLLSKIARRLIYSLYISFCTNYARLKRGKVFSIRGKLLFTLHLDYFGAPRTGTTLDTEVGSREHKADTYPTQRSLTQTDRL